MPKPVPAHSAEHVDQLSDAERRRAVRFRCRRKNTWRLFAAVTCYSGKGTVQDISIRGVSLLVDSLLRPGMFLDLCLQDPEGGSFSQPMLVRVRRVTAQGEGNWLVGCSFVKRLTEEELRLWL